MQQIFHLVDSWGKESLTIFPANRFAPFQRTVFRATLDGPA